MKVFPLLFWILRAWGEPIQMIPPAYPANMIVGASVVVSIRVNMGIVRSSDVLSGTERFAGNVRAAISRWKFPPQPGERELLVIVRFQNPNCRSTVASSQEIPPLQSKPNLPFPVKISDPACPSNLRVSGFVALSAKVSSKGNVGGVHAFASSGIQADTSATALLNWLFLPARDRPGNPVPSGALVVVVFFPTLI
jgi:hypothetical protein